MVCAAPRCSRPVDVEKAGLCRRHYERERRARLASEVSCGECGRPALVASPPLCAGCYKRRRVERNAVACKVLRCERPATILSSRLCDKHYGRWLRLKTSKQFPGLGVLACKLCGDPLLEHPRAGPCEAWDGRLSEPLPELDFVDGSKLGPQRSWELDTEFA